MMYHHYCCYSCFIIIIIIIIIIIVIIIIIIIITSVPDVFVLVLFLFLFLLYLLADTAKNASGKMACVYKMTYSVVIQYTNFFNKVRPSVLLRFYS